jgi:hypothetical protein
MLEGKYGIEGTPQYAKAEKIITDLQRQKFRNQEAFNRGGDLSVTDADKQAIIDAAKDPKTLPTKVAKFNYLFGEGQAEKILDGAKQNNNTPQPAAPSDVTDNKRPDANVASPDNAIDTSMAEFLPFSTRPKFNRIAKEIKNGTANKSDADWFEEKINQARQWKSDFKDNP